MNWQDLLAALGLMLVLEGMLPFLDPSRWRRAVLLVSQLGDASLRMAGFASMLLGLIVVFLVR